MLGIPKVLDEILGDYKAVDRRHWYVQGSNNFQFVPTVLVNDDFFCGVRISWRRINGTEALLKKVHHRKNHN